MPPPLMLGHFSTRAEPHGSKLRGMYGEEGEISKNQIGTQRGPINSSSSTGDLSAPLYAPTVEKEFARLAKDFVLWTGTCVNIFKSPHETPCKGPKTTASSAAVESDFASVKRHTLRGSSGLIRAATRLRSLEGSCRIAGAEQKRLSLLKSNEHNDNEMSLNNEDDNEEVLDSENAPRDLSNTENWGGLELVPKRKRGESPKSKPCFSSSSAEQRAEDTKEDSTQER